MEFGLGKALLVFLLFVICISIIAFAASGILKALKIAKERNEIFKGSLKDKKTDL